MPIACLPDFLSRRSTIDLDHLYAAILERAAGRRAGTARLVGPVAACADVDR